MNRKWTKDSIAIEIVNMHDCGQSVTSSCMARTHASLLRAASRLFGSWEAAVSYSGLDYDQIRRYKSWTREAIIERVQDLHAQGTDLSWRNVVLNVDAKLASAAVKKKHFGSWREAVEAAGLDYDAIRRYREWNDERVLNVVREYHASGKDLNAKNVAEDDMALITAARRRFDTWPRVLVEAGFDYKEIVRRAPFKRGCGPHQTLVVRSRHKPSDV